MLIGLARINKPLRITLDQMMRLIAQCDLLDPHQVDANALMSRTLDGDTESNGIPPTSTAATNSIYSGILPGKTLYVLNTRRDSFPRSLFSRVFSFWEPIKSFKICIHGRVWFFTSRKRGRYYDLCCGVSAYFGGLLDTCQLRKRQISDLRDLWSKRSMI